MVSTLLNPVDCYLAHRSLSMDRQQTSVTLNFLNAGFSVTLGSSSLKILEQVYTTGLTYRVTSADSTENTHSPGQDV